jgi:hypothetical protein
MPLPADTLPIPFPAVGTNFFLKIDPAVPSVLGLLTGFRLLIPALRLFQTERRIWSAPGGLMSCFERKFVFCEPMGENKPSKNEEMRSLGSLTSVPQSKMYSGAHVNSGV